MYSDLSLTVPFLFQSGTTWHQCWRILSQSVLVERGRGKWQGGRVGGRDARQTNNNGWPTIEVCNKMIPRVYDDDFNDDVGKEEGQSDDWCCCS